MNYKLLILAIFFCHSLYAQDNTEKPKREYVAYTLFCNVVPDNCNIPLVGLVNVALGRHQSAQAGLVNTAIGNFTGAQFGLVNTNLKYTLGTQIGLVNTSLEKLDGLHLGLVNTALNSTLGAQVGLVNTSLEETTGLQLGLVNIAKKGISGFQIGLVNYADNISGGIPIGLVSIVKNGGYYAFEMSGSELYPINFAFKFGLPQFYTYTKLSHNSTLRNVFAIGMGAGSLIPMGKNFYFNPEIEMLNSLSFENFERDIHTYSLVAGFRYSLTNWLSVSVAPALDLVNNSEVIGSYIVDWYRPFYSLKKMEVNDNWYFLLGARAGVSVNF